MTISDISLTAGMRGSLLSMQGTSSTIDRTQERLATGRRVNSALDNPTNFFASQSHINRAIDLSGRMDSVKEAIQNIYAANSGTTAITSLLDAANGLANAALGTSNLDDRTAFSLQFDQLLDQIDTLAADSIYRGTNLLKSDSLTVNFSDADGASTFTIAGFDATSAGLGVEKIQSGTSITQTDQAMGTGFSQNQPLLYHYSPYVPTAPLNVGSHTMTIYSPSIQTSILPPTMYADAFAAGADLKVTGSDVLNQQYGTFTVTSGDSQSVTLNVTITAPVSSGDQVYFLAYRPDLASFAVSQRTFGTDYTAAELSNIKVEGTLQTAGTDYDLVTRVGDGKADIVFKPGHEPAYQDAITADVTSTVYPWASNANIQKSQDQVTDAMNTMRSNAKTLASNSSILTTRLDFTSALTSILQSGADNLTLADMNEEGANMLMLQTRQQLGTTSLSMGAQAAQSVLRLF